MDFAIELKQTVAHTESTRQIDSNKFKEDADGLRDNHAIAIAEEYDVIVVGGGTTGPTAAIASARNGAKTLLVEKNGYLGGAMLGGAVCFMGFYNIYYPDCEPVQLIRGIPDELVKRLVAAGGSTGFYDEMHDPTYESKGVHWDRDVLPKVMLEMTEEAGVTVQLNTVVEDVTKEGSSITGVLLRKSSGERFYVKAKMFVDTTGVADLAYQSGAKCTQIKERQTGGMAFGLTNLDLEKAREFTQKRGAMHFLSYGKSCFEEEDHITRFGFQVEKLEEFAPYREEYCLCGGQCMVSNEKNKLNMINAVSMHFDTLDPVEVEKARIKLTQCCLKYAELYQKFVPGFEDSYIDWISPNVGIRFGRLVECEHSITLEEVNQLVVPEDSIGVYGVQDAHAWNYKIRGGWYGIPYRALVPIGVDNLLVAGEMVTSDWVVWMSTRLTGGCLIMGQAAGTAAAMAAKLGVRTRELDVQALREQLRNDNVFLG